MARATLFLLLPAVLCTGCGKRQERGLTVQAGILSAGIEIGYPPMEYFAPDGKTLRGFDIELTEKLAGKLGLKVKFIDTAWEGILAGLNTGEYDIAVNISITPERRRSFDFTRPYIASSMTVVRRAGFPLIISEPADLAGLRAGFQADTTAQYFAEKLAARGVDFRPFSYDKILNCFDDLAAGRIDLVVADGLAARYYTQKDGAADPAFVIAWEGPGEETIGFALKKGNATLLRALDDALAALREDGTIDGISLRVFGSPLPR